MKTLKQIMACGLLMLMACSGLQAQETVRITNIGRGYYAGPLYVAMRERLFEKYGVMAVFIGRFFGPLRAVVPLIAGTATMPLIPFQLANVASALLWAAVVLAPGAFGAEFVQGVLN